MNDKKISTDINQLSDKERINVSTIGHVDSGKTTLTAAITKVSSNIYGYGSPRSYAEIDSAKEEKERGITIRETHVWYVTENRFCNHIDCPGHADYIKNMIVGSSKIDVAILVITVTDGIMPQSREHISLIAELEVKTVIVYMNKMDTVDVDADGEMLVYLAEEEVREFLAKYKYENVTFIRGSAVKAMEENFDNASEYGIESIKKLIDTIDKSEIGVKEIDGPFALQVEDVCSITGRGTVVTGRVVRGKIFPNEKVEIIGNDKSIETVVTSIERYRTVQTSAVCGDDIGILLRGIDKDTIHRGNLIASVGTVKRYSKFKVKLYILTKEEGGRKKGFGIDYSPQFFIRSGDVTGTFKSFENEGESVQFVLPGEHVTAYVELKKPYPMEKDLKLIVRESITIAAGRVLELIE